MHQKIYSLLCEFSIILSFSILRAKEHAASKRIECFQSLDPVNESKKLEIAQFAQANSVQEWKEERKKIPKLCSNTFLPCSETQFRYINKTNRFYCPCAQYSQEKKNICAETSQKGYAQNVSLRLKTVRKKRKRKVGSLPKMRIEKKYIPSLPIDLFHSVLYHRLAIIVKISDEAHSLNVFNEKNQLSQS